MRGYKTTEESFSRRLTLIPLINGNGVGGGCKRWVAFPFWIPKTPYPYSIAEPEVAALLESHLSLKSGPSSLARAALTASRT